MTTNDTLRVTDSRTGRSYELPIVDGAIRAIDLRQIKTSDDDFGLLSYDPAFQNTASCRSAITFIDGDKGILRYRGYPIEELAEPRVLPGRGLAAAARRAAGQGRVGGVGPPDLPPHLRARERQEVHRRLPPRRPPDGHPGEHAGRAVHLLPGGQGGPRPGQPGRAGGAADRQDADAGGLRLPARPGAALRVPRRRPVLRGQLPEHDGEDDRAQVRPGPGARARPRRAVHPARRPRAELLHQRDAQRGPAPRSTRTRRRPRPRRRSTARCTAARTSRC